VRPAARDVQPAANAASPLSPAHLAEVRAAHARGAKVRRAIGVARFGGWTVGIFGGLTLLFGLFSASGWLMGIGMLIAARGEFRGATGLARFDPLAARRLAWNQVFLAGVLIAYSAWGAWSSLTGPDPLAASAAGSPEVAQMLAPYGSLVRKLSMMVYAAIALIAVGAQGGTAWYYFSREKHVRAFVAQTPAWVVDFLRTR
jgi:hypothetical protein